MADCAGEATVKDVETSKALLASSAENPATSSFDDVLETLGTPGKFQITQAVIGLMALAIITFMSMSFVFLGFEPPHTCNRVNESQLLSEYSHVFNDSTADISYRSCEITISANQSESRLSVVSVDCPNGRNFSDKKHTTWLSEWDLVCESKNVAGISFTCYNAGLIIGGLCASSLADRFGRKIVLVISAFMCTLLEALIILSPNIYVIFGLRFLGGISRQGLSESSFILGMELMVPRHRDVYGICMCITWVFFLLISGGLGFAFQDSDWRYLQATVGVSGLIFLVYPLALCESPRWLAANHRHKEALAVLEKACRANRANFNQVKAALSASISTQQTDCKPMEDYSNAKHQNEEETDLDSFSEYEKNTKENFFSLFRYKELAIVTLALWFIWFAHNMTYYGLYLVSSSLAGNRFLNFILMGLVEIPSNLLALFLMKKMKRLHVLRIFIVITALSFLSSSFLLTFGGNSRPVAAASTALFILGKLTVTAGYNTMNVITSEIYPTNVRTVGFASCNGISRAGGMMAPYIRPLIAVATWVPGVVFTSLMLLAFLLSFVTPETKGVKLSDTVEETRNRLVNCVAVGRNDGHR